MNSKTEPQRASVITAWLDGLLETERAEELRILVERPGRWQDAYRRALQELSNEFPVLVPLRDPKLSLSVAMSDAEVADAELVELLPLPHLGPKAHREGRITALGTLWRVVDADGRSFVPTDVEVPYGTRSLTWEDPVLGAHTTQLREYVPEPLRAAHNSLLAVFKLADGLEHPRGRAVALEVAKDLGGGALRDGLASAREAFVNAKLDDADEQAWAVTALEIQLALDRLAHRLCDAELDAQLLAVEQALGPLREALLLLDEWHYGFLVERTAVDKTAWWGFPAWFDGAVV